MKVSGVIITLNEEEQIGRCLESMQTVVDEIVVVDSYSDDQTVAICESYGAKVTRRKFTNHIDQKNYAINLATYDLILYLDADEALSPRLRNSILSIKNSGAHFDGYSMNRKSKYCGKWLDYAWYPDTKIRLWDRSKGLFDGENPHDRVILKRGNQVHLDGDILHNSYESLDEHREQLSKYVEIAAQAKYNSGKHANLLIHIILGPIFKFIRLFIFKGGIFDGYRGFAFSIISAQHNFQKYSRLRQLQLTNTSGKTFTNLFTVKYRRLFR